MDNMTILQRMEMTASAYEWNLFGGFASFLNLCFDKEESTREYIYNKDKTNSFIDELMKMLDCYLESARGFGLLGTGDREEAYYRAFFYLTIRLSTMQRTYRYEDCTRVGHFNSYAEDSVMQLTRDEFLSRYAYLRWYKSPLCHIPKMLGKIDTYLYLVNRSGFYLGDDKKYIERSKNYVLSCEEGVEQDELESFEASERQAYEYLMQDVDFDGPDLVDQDDLEQAVSDYFEGIFYYGSDDMPYTIQSTIRLYLIDKGIIDTRDFEDEEFARWGIAHNMKWADSNLFIDDNVTSLSNCCRLKSNIDDLGYFNSIGGTALKVGSVKVSTINLARLALTNSTEQDYLVALRDLVELDCKVLDVVRHIITRNVEKGLLPNFSKGLVDFEHLYNTIGFIGIYETMKTFGYTKQDEFGNTFYTEDADRFGKKIFEVIHRTKDQFVLDKNYKMNCEQIPKHHWGIAA